MISIIIVCFNSLKELKLTIPSIFIAVDKVRKTIPYKFEVIISDDGSDDGSQEWVKENFPEVRYLWHKNIGRGPNRNFGASHANGDYLVFIDSDIEVDPISLTNLLNPVLENPDVISFGKIQLVIGEKPSPLDYYLHHKCEKLMGRFKESLNPMESYSAFFSLNRKVFNRVKGFSSEFDQYGGEDTDFFLRCNKADASFFFASDAVGWHIQKLDLHSNLTRIYWGNYSSVQVLPYVPVRESLEKAFDRRISKKHLFFYFMSKYKLWSKLKFLHYFFQFLPQDNRLAFYFYHYLFLETANRGYGDGIKRLSNEN